MCINLFSKENANNAVLPTEQRIINLAVNYDVIHIFKFSKTLTYVCGDKSRAQIPHFYIVCFIIGTNKRTLNFELHRDQITQL